MNDTARLPETIAERAYMVSAYGCRRLPDALTAESFIDELQVAAERAGATVVRRGWFHAFTPYGITIVLVLAESAAVIHTYPEREQGVTVNVATCGTVHPQDVVEQLLAVFEPHTRVSETSVIPLMLPRPQP